MIGNYNDAVDKEWDRFIGSYGWHLLTVIKDTTMAYDYANVMARISFVLHNNNVKDVRVHDKGSILSILRRGKVIGAYYDCNVACLGDPVNWAGHRFVAMDELKQELSLLERLSGADIEVANEQDNIKQPITNEFSQDWELEKRNI